ncbi:MAG: glycerol-3-phosphate dehydrogenase [candidate division KSB1 bacterium]|nr:glycerol-3-phosphate dehydrogenase [candidate division KSB1 bacterium]MDZ7305096.1 glycerol-3-phosphate dehydrogenase [candidate division KSB1 bacterium]MDZ7313413.1 glycerol-3-phosphate dehydrogenase [candidate division KSB1 bacterium]
MPSIPEIKWSGWGRSDKSYHLPAASAFWNFLTQKLGPLSSNPAIDSLDRITLRPSRLADHDVKLLQNIAGEKNVSAHPYDRVVHSLGKSYPDLIRIRQGHIAHPTDVVVYPETEAQIEAILKLAREKDWIVIPFGGGTSVVGGVEPPADSRKVITHDLRRLNKILSIDSESMLATIQCGILGPELERQLNAAGYSLGHFPQSFEFSTLGGWIATRSAGQYSTQYGKIEDMVCSLRVITPTGTIQTPQVPAAAAGSDLVQMLIGSEGNYGIITQATVKLHPLPRYRKFPSFLFHSFEEGVIAARQLLQMGIRPTLLRLSDETETEMGAMLGGLTRGIKNRLGKWWIEKKGFSFLRSAVLILGFEAGAGKAARTLLEAELQIAKEVMKQNGGLFIGQSAGKSWHKKRFELPYLRDLLLDRAVMVDTLETATTWQNLLTLHRAVKQSLVQAIEAEQEKALVLTHLSHAYPDGASLYYTFFARQKPAQELAQWQRVKNAATDCIVQNGGALSHHHGIGAMHKPWLQQYASDLGIRMMRGVKTALDPEGLMNPGKLVIREEIDLPAQKIRGAFSHRTRAENLDRFAKEQFDVVIIGGGITGAGIARDAAMRGMKVALIEKGDFANGTSSKSSKMIHGGLRYLKQLDLKLVKESLRERETLLHLAPHLVHPVPYLIPSYKGRLEKIELQIGMIGYDILAGSKSLAHYQKLSADEIIREEPLLKRSGLHGGFVYYDCLVNDARLTLATLKSASEHGAVVANYVKCVGLETDNGMITGVHFQDVLGGGRGTIRAKVVVNATGPWTDTIRAFAGENEKMLRPTKGIHVVVDREKLNVRHIVVISTHDERMIFVVPLGAFTYIGTTDTDYTGPLDEVYADAEDVSYLLQSTNEAFDDVHLTADDIVSTWAGLRPLINEEGKPSTVSRDYEITVSDKGLVTIAGGKLTTYRSMAEELLDEILGRFTERFDHPFAECQTAKIPLYGGDIAEFATYVAGEMKGVGNRWGLAPKVVVRLLHHYGTDYLKILSLGLIDRDLLQPLSSDTEILKGEVIYAVEDEMAMTLKDFMERRVDLQHFDPQRGLNVAEKVAHLMGKRLQWDEAERQRQVEAYRNAVEEMMAFRQAQILANEFPATESTKTTQLYSLRKC